MSTRPRLESEVGRACHPARPTLTRLSWDLASSPWLHSALLPRTSSWVRARLPSPGLLGDRRGQEPDWENTPDYEEPTEWGTSGKTGLFIVGF